MTQLTPPKFEGEYLLDGISGLRKRSQSPLQFCSSDFDPAKLGKQLGVGAKLRTENQGQTNCCAAHMITTLAESCILLASEFSTSEQLSRMFAMVTGQTAWQGSPQGDVGCSIEGVVRAAAEVGICRESTMPWTGQYYTRIPPAAADEAKLFRLGAHIEATNVLQVYEFLAQRNGGLALGVNWNDYCRNPKADGRIESWQEQIDWRGNPIGGLHAVPIVDWSDQFRDGRGWPYFELDNSHGDSYGNHGKVYLSPTVLELMLRGRYSAAFLVSDMTFIKPRFDWRKGRFFA